MVFESTVAWKPPWQRYTDLEIHDRSVVAGIERVCRRASGRPGVICQQVVPAMPVIVYSAPDLRLLRELSLASLRAAVPGLSERSRAPPSASQPPSSLEAVVRTIKPGGAATPFHAGGQEMSIHDFHSVLISRNEKNALLEALRKLMSADLKIFSSEEEPAPGGWIPWDGSLPTRCKPAEA